MRQPLGVLGKRPAQRHAPGRISAGLPTGTTVEVSFDDSGRIGAVAAGAHGGRARAGHGTGPAPIPLCAATQVR
ncbi:hypothetical protein [Streptomyces decoyicus]|uniref:hypothetical protein n=1 Tax=Streptomyces decoyicus TaxID=249567 RepID=UPI0033A7248D